MQAFIEKVQSIFRDPVIRKRIGFTIGALVVFRLFAAIPVPGIDAQALQRFLSGNQLFSFFDVFSGGGISHFSIVMLGVGPFVTASIILQLLTMMIPSLKTLAQEEGEAGRAKLSQYTRLLSVPLAALQALGFLKLLETQHVTLPFTMMSLTTNIIVITAGSILLMWIGELISEFGIGNGSSLIIFAGIVAGLPSQIGQFFVLWDSTQLPLYVVILAVIAFLIVAVVAVTEAERLIPVSYAKQTRGEKTYGGISTYLPLRLNQAGVIPIIFALALLVFPKVIATYFATLSNATVAAAATWVLTILANGWIYNTIYFALVVVFTYFYTAVTFDPNQMAENLQKSGAFIAGIRPGEPTMQYISNIVTRLTLVGALFLGVVAVLPLILQSVTGNTIFAIGGTALLIVVSVVLDLLKKLDAQVSMREY